MKMEILNVKDHTLAWNDIYLNLDKKIDIFLLVQYSHMILVLMLLQFFKYFLLSVVTFACASHDPQPNPPFVLVLFHT